LSGGEREARTKTTDGLECSREAVGRRGDRQGEEKIGCLTSEAEVEVRAKDSDDLVRDAVDREGSAQDVRIGAEPGFPKLMGENYYLTVVLGGEKPTPGGRLEAEKRQEVGGGADGVGSLGTVGEANGGGGGLEGGKVREDIGAGAVIEIVGCAEGEAGEVEFEELVPDHYERCGVPIGEG
jgi:hypothetical protein